MKILLATFSDISDHQDKVVGLYEEIKKRHDAYLMVANDVQIPVSRNKKTILTRCPKRPGICRGTFDIVTLFKLLYQIRKENFDVVFFETLHIWNIPFLLWGGKHTKKFQMIHDVVPHQGDREYKMVDLMNKLVCVLADKIIICNKKYKNILCKNYMIDESRVVSVPLWEKFPKYNYTKRTGRVLFFGRINPYKGVDNLEKIVELCPEVQFDVIGKVDSQVQNIVDRISLKKNVQINSGYILEEEIESIFKNSDLVLLPYNSATQSGIILDAYKFSKPVLAFDVGAISEQIEDGVSGFLVKKGDIQDFVNKLKKIFYMSEDNYERICESAFTFGKKNFSTTNVVDVFLEIFSNEGE